MAKIKFYVSDENSIDIREHSADAAEVTRISKIKNRDTRITDLDILASRGIGIGTPTISQSSGIDQAGQPIQHIKTPWHMIIYGHYTDRSMAVVVFPIPPDPLACASSEEFVGEEYEKRLNDREQLARQLAATLVGLGDW